MLGKGCYIKECKFSQEIELIKKYLSLNETTLKNGIGEL